MLLAILVAGSSTVHTLSLPYPCSLPASSALQELLLFGELSMYVPLYVYLGTVAVNVSLQFRWKADADTASRAGKDRKI